MKRICLFLLCTVLVGMFIMLVANTAYSLNEEDFTEVEYHYILQNIEKWETLDVLPQEMVTLFDIFEFESGADHYKVMNADTPDRILQKDTLLLRVRANVKKPDKSKITLKTRSTDMNALVDDIPGAEYELDVSVAKTTYSGAVDIKFTDEDLDVNTLTPESILNYINLKEPALLHYLAPIRDNPEARLPGVVDRYKFEGKLKEHAFAADVEFDFEIWTFGPEQYLVELAFSGETERKAELDQLYTEIGEFLAGHELLNPEQFSKTNYYFELFMK